MFLQIVFDIFLLFELTSGEFNQYYFEKDLGKTIIVANYSVKTLSANDCLVRCFGASCTLAEYNKSSSLCRLGDGGESNIIHTSDLDVVVFQVLNIIDECTSFPCQNAGTCIDTVNGYSCICPEGSTGLNCEQDIDECQSSPCMNNGSCVDMLNGYTCTCVPGYSGIHCEQDINECSSSPCQNGSTCVDGINEYSCACIAGFTGVNCEQDIDECASLPCQNGGTCVSGVNLYTCACTAGFYGINCAAINICSSSPCQNGGTCVNMLFGYLCTCLPEYTGLHCEQACFTGSPWNYTGTINLTLTGRQCQRWDSQTPHSHTCTDLQYFPETVLADAQNYCRNPESSYDTPWCFTTDAAKEWENCDVIEC